MKKKTNKFGSRKNLRSSRYYTMKRYATDWENIAKYIPNMVSRHYSH